MSPNTPEYWNQVYLGELRPGWDMDGPTPLLEELLEAAPTLPPGTTLAVPGCGFGHDAAALAQRGFDVAGFDFAPLALEGARAKYGTAVNWLQEDWFATQQGPFGAIFDHTCFVAMEPPRREAYVARTAALLKPGGLWLLAAFHDTQGKEGPPFAIEPEALRALVAKPFEILHIAPATHSHPRRANREFLVIARVRAT